MYDEVNRCSETAKTVTWAWHMNPAGDLLVHLGDWTGPVLFVLKRRVCGMRGLYDISLHHISEQRL